jgi:ribosomal protein S12 methylthiotransferase
MSADPSAPVAGEQAPLRVGMISLGCAKNLVDSEVMLGHLDRAELPDRSVEPGDDRPAAVERHGVASAASPSTVAAWGAAHYLYDDATPRRLATPHWTAYIKIAEGCDHGCSFCAIPSFRGAFRSRDPESILREARDLARRGVREVNLIAQDSSHYGRDLGLREGLARLLGELDAIPQLRWIRLHYLYPNTITADLIDTMSNASKVLNYIDLPLQHAHPATLRRMRRGGGAEAHLKLLEQFRSAMPDATLRSTFIVGFPGETEQEFRALLEFVDQARLDHMGVFAYSHEERTPAYELDDDVPHEIKCERSERLMARQQALVFEANASRIGRREIVVVEGSHPETEHLLVGRSWRQAPDVDGMVLINDGVASPGEFVEIELTDTAGYDLVGRIVGPA